ncbi:MAG: hypothetical protein ACRC2T_02365 [Thermoguttaceae bacterium]
MQNEILNTISEFGPTMNLLLRTTWQGAVLAVLVLMVLIIFGRKIPASCRFLLLGIVLIRFLLPLTPPSDCSVFGLVPHEESKQITQIDNNDPQTQIVITQCVKTNTSVIDTSDTFQQTSLTHASKTTDLKSHKDTNLSLEYEPQESQIITFENDAVTYNTVVSDKNEFSITHPDTTVEKTADTFAENTDAMTPVLGTSKPVTARDIAFYISVLWLVGFTVFLARIIIGKLVLNRLCKSGQHVLPPVLAQIISECKQTVNFRRDITVNLV